MKIREGTAHRLSVFRTARHIYAQISSPDGAKVVVSASTLDKAMREGIAYGGNASAASAIGKEVAERAKAAGIESVAFDRSGYKYHGRVKALADAAREHGLKF
jgi:large subunit ribosomal protein L18